MNSKMWNVSILGNPTSTNRSVFSMPSGLTHSITDYIAMITLSIIFLIGVPGNIFVLYIFGIRRKKCRTRFETLLLLLGVTDCVSMLFIPTSFFYLTFTKFQVWHFGFIGCKIIPTILQMSVTISQGILVLISYERYHAIVYPFKIGFTNKCVCVWFVFVFIISIIFVLPYMFSFQIIKNPLDNTEACVPVSESYNLLMASSFMQLSRDLVALSILATLRIRMHKSLTRSVTMATWDRLAISTKGRKLLKIVVLVFLILTLPEDIFLVFFYIFGSLFDMSDGLYNKFVDINTFLNILQISNSVVNVFIYSRMHSYFKDRSCCPKRKEKRRSTVRSMDSERSTEFDHLFQQNNLRRCVETFYTHKDGVFQCNVISHKQCMELNNNTDK